MSARQPVGREGLRRAGRYAVGTGRVAGSGLVAVLCAGALAPVITADPGQVGAAVAGLVGSVGGNVLTDVITTAVDRLRGGRAGGDALSQGAVERALAAALEEAFAGDRAAGAAMRQLAAELLKEAGAVRAVLEGAASADPQAALALAEGLAGLGEQFGQFASTAADLRGVVLSLEEELARAAGERRAGAQRDRQMGLLLERIAEVVEAPGGLPGEAAGGSPYLGLAPFQVEDAGVFFGRAAMTRSLMRTVRERSRSGGLLLVLGASGAGKSSLLRAGLAAALARGGPGKSAGLWPVRVLTPTAHPLGELAAHLADLAGREAGEVERILAVSPQRAADLAAEALARHARAGGDERGSLVLVVDQFEELFTLVEADTGWSTQRDRFVQALAALCTPPTTNARRTVAVVVAAVRGDFLDQAAGLPLVAEAVSTGPFFVGAMTRAELGQAVQGPAAAAGVLIEPQLVEVVLREAYGPRGAAVPGAGVLPLVSQALAATWRLRRGKALTLRSYRRAGGIAAAVDRGAQQIYRALDERGKTAARTMFLLLTRVTSEGQVVRRTAPRTELYSAAGLSRHDGDAVLGAFAADRLLVFEGENVAICHDVLLEAWRQLHEWLQGDAADRALYGDLLADADAWQAQRRSRDYLYRPGQLEAVTTAVTRWQAAEHRYPPLTDTAQDFLAAARRAARRTRRAWQSAFAALAVLTLLAGGTTLLAERNAQQANAQRAVALSRQLAADSDTYLEHNPVLARQLAVTAWTVSQTAQANAAIGKLLASDYEQGQIVTSAGIDTLAFSPDGRILAAGASDGTIRLWNPTTRQTVAPALRDDAATLDGGVSSVVFSPDGHTLAAGAGDGTVRLWNPATGQLTRTVRGDGAVFSIAFSPDGHTLAAGEDGGTVRLWNPTTGQLVGTLIRDAASTGTGMDVSVVFSPDGHTLATRASDGTIRLWDPPSGRPTRTIQDDIPTNDIGGVSSIAFSPDGHSLAAGEDDGTVRLWNPTTGQPTAPTLQNDMSLGTTVKAVTFSRDGHTLAVGNQDGTVQLWNPATGQLTRTVGAPNNGNVLSVAISPDGRTLAAGVEGSVQLWSPNTGQPITPTLQDNAPTDISGSVYSVALSPDGHTLAAGAGDGTVRLWNPTTGQLVTSPLQNGTSIGIGAVSSIAFSPDGRILAAGTGDGTVGLWNPITGQPTRTIHDDTPTNTISGVSSVAFSPDGHTLAVGAGDGTIRLWNPITGQPTSTIHDDAPTKDSLRVSVAFSPDGHILAAAASDGTVRLWNPATGQPTRTIHDDTQASSGVGVPVAFSPDGHTLAAGTPDGSVRLWNPATGQPLDTPIEDATTIGLPRAVLSLAFSPDGHTLAIGTDGGTVRLWNPATGQPLGTPVQDAMASSGGLGWVLSVAFSPDGHTLAAGTDDGTVRLWPAALLSNGLSTLCTDVGLIDSTAWTSFIPGEQEPSTCANVPPQR